MLLRVTSRPKKKTSATLYFHCRNLCTCPAEFSVFLLPFIVYLSCRFFCTLRCRYHSLQYAIFKVFAKHFSDGFADYFVCQTDKTQTLPDAYNNSRNARAELLEWAARNGVKTRSIWEKAKAKLHDDLRTHKFYIVSFAPNCTNYSLGSVESLQTRALYSNSN